MTESAEKGLESLNIWQDAMKLAIKVCKDVIPNYLLYDWRLIS